jgi:hypothetical protein
MQIAPRTGGLAATITVGTSVADYRGSLAQASSQTVDLGLIGTDATIQCDANPPLLRPNQLPQPLVAESDKGNAHATKSTAGTGKSGVVAVAGRERVDATTRPQSTASFEGDRLVIPGVVTVKGMQSHSHARLVAGKARIATGTARISSISLLSGKVVLSGLQWRARQRTGTHRASTVNFRIGTAHLAGRSLPVSGPSVDATIATINKAIKSTGVHLTMPAQTHDHGKLAVSPMTIGIDNSKIGGKTVNPILGVVQPVTNKLSELVTGIDCRLGNFLTLADLALSAVDGTGGLDLNLGGAMAVTDDKAYGNPFGHSLGGKHPLGSSLPHQHTSPSSGSATTTTTTSSGRNGSAGSPATAGTTPPPGTVGANGVSASCSTTSPAGRPSCSPGRGLVVGLVALGLIAAFAVTDFFVLRVRRNAAASE